MRSTGFLTLNLVSQSRSFPGFDRLYSLGDPIASRPFRGGFSRVGEAVRVLRGEVSVADSAPVDVPWEMGSHVPGDVIWTTAANVVVVSSRVIDLLLDYRFTGWGTYPVRVTGKYGEHLLGYFGLSLLGRCDPPDLGRSEIVMREYPGGWFPHIRGYYFDEVSWDGSDLFMERPDERGKAAATKYVTEPVVRALRKAKLRNLDFDRLSEKEVSLDVFEIGTAYRLPHDIQDRVARARRVRATAPGA